MRLPRLDPIDCLRLSGRRQKATSQLVTGAFLADRTIGRAFGTMCRLSVCLSVTFCIVAKQYVLSKNCLKERIENQVKELIFWVAAVFLLPVSPIWPPRRPFLPYGRPNLALAGILVTIFSLLQQEIHDTQK